MVEISVVEIAKFVLQLIQSVLVWPAAAILIAWWFRSELSSLIAEARDWLGKVRKASWGPAALEIPSTQPTTPAEANSEVETVAGSGVGTPGVRHANLEDLKRVLHYERIYNAIYGSQWAFLRTLHDLDTVGMPIERARKFVEDWMGTRKIEGTEFPKWFGFLHTNRLAEVNEEPGGAVVRITRPGRDFYDYIYSRYDPPPFRPF